MTLLNRKLLLRANGAYLIFASTVALLALDLPALFFGAGPAAAVLANAPHAGIGFVEAHGLAFILGVLLWNAPAIRYSHLTASAVQSLLGVANLVFWPIFIASGMVAAGLVLTAIHLSFAGLQYNAARRSDLQLT